MARLFLSMPNRPIGEVIQVTAGDGSWTSLCENGGTTEIPGDVDVYIPEIQEIEDPNENDSNEDDNQEEVTN